MREILEAFLDEIRLGRRAVLATIVRSSGSTPRTMGARMIVYVDGSTRGTIGGGAFEAMVTVDAKALMSAPAPAPELKRYTFTETGEDALGMACGGTAEVLLEPTGPAERLIVFGAGHVGLALARLARTVGFAPELIDDRPEWCALARAAGLGSVWQCGADYASGMPELDPSCYIAVVTRCHRTDLAALKSVLGVGARYVGLIGSRRKKAVIFAALESEHGVPPEALARVHCPIGLPIGGETPEEIAVSIVAELLQVKNSK